MSGSNVKIEPLATFDPILGRNRFSSNRKPQGTPINDVNSEGVTKIESWVLISRSN